jgi:alpha/beta superfamily hydrolase
MAVYKKGDYIGEKLLIDGPAGKLQIQTSYPQDFSPEQPMVIISHPHPLYGGNMTSKVVYNVARAFNEMGYAAIRYNFRGVAQSEGEFDSGIGETKDLLTVVQFFAQRHPESSITLAGFSFGAYITVRAISTSAQLELSPTISPILSLSAMLLVAPPVSMYDFSDLAIANIPWMVIQGGKDEIVDPQQVAAWAAKQLYKPQFHYLQDADHFFHGEMDWLREVITTNWT